VFVGPDAAAILQTVVIEAIFLIDSLSDKELATVWIVAPAEEAAFAVPDVVGDRANVTCPWDKGPRLVVNEPERIVIQGVAVADSMENSNEIALIKIPINDTRKITIKGYDNIVFPRFSSDSQSIFCGALKGNNGDEWILRVDRNGGTFPIIRLARLGESMALTSPDGRHLAVLSDNAEANVWTLEDF